MGIGGQIKDSARALFGHPVKNQAYAVKELRDKLALTGWCDYSAQDWQFSEELLRRNRGKPPKRLIWLLCDFSHPYGGVFTILRAADYLQKRGWDNRLIVYDNPRFSVASQLESIQKYFPSLTADNFGVLTDINELPDSAAAIGTFWPSCYHLLKLRNTAAKVYFIQDFEPAFYPAGTEYALCENTYRMPFHRLVNTQGLMRFVAANYPRRDIKESFFTPAVDGCYSFALKPLKPPIRLLIYARPNTPRNAFELAYGFAKRLKEDYGNQVEIVGAGEGKSLIWEVCKGAMEYAGVIDYDKLPAFYSSFHLLAAFMLTKHPCYLPLEAMATGCGIIANQNEANAWLLRDKVNCVAPKPAVTPMVEAFDWLIQPENYRSVTQAAYQTVQGFDWETELARIEMFFRTL